jgi:hypothetical protein
MATLLRQYGCGPDDVRALFPGQVKRIHEYKRQLLNVLRIVVLYSRMRENPPLEVTPRAFCFAGNAAPAYQLAKLIIKLINNLAGTIDGDPSMRGRLKVVFQPELAVAIRYLLTHRPYWPAHAVVGKTLVISSMINRVVLQLGRRLCEVPVGFKWFVRWLFDGSCCFGGEESAGASFLRQDGAVWTTDKDGPIMDLLAAEIPARTGRDPGEHYRRPQGRRGSSCFRYLFLLISTARA